MKACCKEYLVEQFGDEDVVNEIYAEYVESMKTKLSETDAARASGDWLQVDRAAHAMKGNALAAGDNAVAEAAIALRNAAKLQNAAEADGLIAQLKELAQEL